MTAKRLLDLALTIPGLVLLAPLLLAIGAWVRLDGPGPVIFRQQRVGRGGRLFTLLKFRTMVPDAELIGARVTTGDDSRITRSGRFLRRYKLDELPQLFNVLGGSMSLVGPRPEVPEFVAEYPPAIRDKVLSVRPGITDLAAIEFRNEADLLAATDDPRETYLRDVLPCKLKLYERYVDNRSVALDIRIIVRTLAAIVR